METLRDAILIIQLLLHPINGYSPIILKLKFTTYPHQNESCTGEEATKTWWPISTAGTCPKQWTKNSSHHSVQKTCVMSRKEWRGRHNTDGGKLSLGGHQQQQESIFRYPSSGDLVCSVYIVPVACNNTVRLRVVFKDFLSSFLLTERLHEFLLTS